MSEVNNLKRKRSVSYIVNPDGYCTPSDSETDDDGCNKSIQRKTLRRQATDNEQWLIANIDGDESNSSITSSDRSNHGNNQLLYAALQKIHELETELAELDEADHDSGLHDEDDGDRESSTEIEENQVLHDHREAILDDQPEALGFAFCVKETFEYLAAQGISQDNAIINSLREKFLGQCKQ